MTEPTSEMGTGYPLDDENTTEYLAFDDLDDDLDTESGPPIRTIVSVGAAVLVAALAVIGGIALSSESSGANSGSDTRPSDPTLAVTVAPASPRLHIKTCDRPATARFTATLVSKRTPVEVSYRWVDNGKPGTDRQVTLRNERTTLTHKITGTGAGRVGSTVEVLSPRVETPAPAVIRVTCGTSATTSGPEPRTGTGTATVPALTGLSIVDASAALRERGLAVEVSYVAGGFRDVVRKTSPGAGTEVAKGSTVVLVVELGKQEPSTLAMPDVIDKTERQARAALRAAGWHGELRIELVEAQQRSEHGLVVDQIPAAGADITADDVIEIAIAQFLEEPEPSVTTTHAPPQPRDPPDETGLPE